ISGIGGIQQWQDALEHMLLGASTVQVCTAVMHYGFRIVHGLVDGLTGWMREKGFASPREFIGQSGDPIKDWGDLALNFKVVAQIDPVKCINCGLCYIACEDGCHQSIKRERVPEDAFLKQVAAAAKSNGGNGRGNGREREAGLSAESRIFISGTDRYIY